MEAPPLHPELTRALDLPSDTSVIDAVDAIDHDAVASTLRKGMRLVEEMTELATEAAELLPQVAAGSTTRMIPFAEHVRFEADTGEVEFAQSSDLAIAVAERVLPSWARAARLLRPGSRRFAGVSVRRVSSSSPRSAGSRWTGNCSSFASARRWWSSAFGRSTVGGAWSVTAWLICRDP